jgi:hypothetical protein
VSPLEVLAVEHDLGLGDVVLGFGGLHLRGVDLFDHRTEAELGGLADEVERPLGVLDAWQLHDDVVALAGHLGFGDTEGVDPPTHDADRLVELLVARRLGRLQHHRHPALQVETEQWAGCPR